MTAKCAESWGMAEVAGLSGETMVEQQELNPSPRPASALYPPGMTTSEVSSSLVFIPWGQRVRFSPMGRSLWVRLLKVGTA